MWIYQFIEVDSAGREKLTSFQPNGTPFDTIFCLKDTLWNTHKGWVMSFPASVGQQRYQGKHWVVYDSAGFAVRNVGSLIGRQEIGSLYGAKGRSSYSLVNGIETFLQDAGTIRQGSLVRYLRSEIVINVAYPAPGTPKHRVVPLVEFEYGRGISRMHYATYYTSPNSYILKLYEVVN